MKKYGAAMHRMKVAIVGAIGISTVVVAVLSGCTSAPAPKATRTTATGTVKGTITVTDSGHIDFSSQGTMPCSVLSDSGYSDVRQGAEVDAVDASGKVLAFASLQPGSTPDAKALGDTCVFPFTISGVPRGEKVYGLQFGRRGIVHYKENAMFGGHADISIGG